jgi:predicted DNA-binding protein
MPKKNGTPKEATSIRLTTEAKRLLRLLADKAGVSQAAWLETIIRKEAERKKVEVEP